MELPLNNGLDLATFYLTLAINHFVSTGDYVGIGSMMAVNDEAPFFVIAVNKLDPVDQEDFRRFRDRLLWVKPKLLRHKIQVDLDETPMVSGEKYDTYRMTLPLNTTDLMLMAGAIAQSGEPTGWGVSKRDVDRFFEKNPVRRQLFDDFLNFVAPYLVSVCASK